jgi:hemerythrin-like metal-binding protein
LEPHIWKIEWNDGMSVGIPEIDEEHKRFASLVNEFNRAIVDRMDLGEIKKRLQLILEDAEQHFAHEERLFKQWNYPDVEDHANIHAQITKDLHAVMDKFISYDLASEWIETGLKVKDILIKHVLTEDMKYAKYYRDSRAAQGTQ